MFDPEKPPELSVTRWFNTPDPLTLAGLKGKVVAILAFQMLCPGCVSHALPQLRKFNRQFSEDEVAVIGLHSVFEHHGAMTPEALEAFIHEYDWEFPIAVDAPAGSGLPKTMAAYEMRGTPTLLLFDRQGRLRRHYFGQLDDMRLAAEAMALSIERADAPREASIAIERKLHQTLVDPDAHAHGDHGHEHGDDCGCDHDHGAHGHDHHGHDHGHDHHGHGDPIAEAVAKAAAKPAKKLK